MTFEVSADLIRVKREISSLDQRNAWIAMQSKDVPVTVTTYVSTALRSKSVDEVRESLGMKSPTDPRWRKIMTAIRTGKRIDATGIFVQWMERNEKLGNALSERMDEILKEQKPFSKMVLEAMQVMSRLQLDTVKLGKELGVFVDPSDQKGQGGQGVTIVVQTNIPSPAKDVVAEHQAKVKERSAALLEANKPK